MEISARVLREVEFNSSLRGYNTDEVDEFLEQVADAVERLQEELTSVRDRVETVERGAKEKELTDTEDDDSIRRTLILAQRTADMAIREAQEEATKLMDRSRLEAETLVSDARDSAQRISSEAERRLKDEVSRLSGTRDGLKNEIDTLVSLLAAERERLTETLGAALRYVERSLSPAPELLKAAPAERPGPQAPASSDTGAGAGGTVEATSDDAEVRSADAVVNGERSGAAAPSETPASMDAETEAGAERPGAVDDLELAIAEDAAQAAPTYHRRYEPEQYDWDSVMRGRPDPLFPDHGRADRPNLTALPSMQDRSDSASAKGRTAGGDRPA